MIFWIFVIIAVIGAIVCCSFSQERRKLKKLEFAKDAAFDRYCGYTPLPNNKESIELNRRLREEYHAADKAYDEAKSKNNRKEFYANIAGGFMIGALIILLIMSLGIIISYACSGGERARLEADYEVLSWEVENNIYQDGGDDIVGKKELYNQVREWNANLASNQYYEKNFWVGIFVPNIYGDLKPIELK